jgi:hypothetical protein
MKQLRRNFFGVKFSLAGSASARGAKGKRPAAGGAV